jgi:rhomboid family protein
VLPLRDRNPTTRRAWITLALIATNVLVFLLWQPTFETQNEQNAFFYCRALVPYEITHQTSLALGGPRARAAIREDYGEIRAAEAIQSLLQRQCPRKSWFAPLLVSMFLHGGWLHLIGNMLFLWVFGNNVEDRLGHVPFLGFYLLGGLAASLLQIAFAPNSSIPNVGASGAIAAVLGSYIVMFPRARILALVFLVAPVEVPAAFVLGSWFVVQFFSGVGSIGAEIHNGVAYWAHVGGFVAGVTATLLWFPRGRVRAVAQLPPRPDI